MLNKFFRSVFLIFTLSVVFQTAAWADAIEGRVQKAGSRSLEVVVYDAQGRPYPNALLLNVDSRTRLNGVSSVTALRPQDAVGAQIRQEESGNWRADEITLFQEMNAQPATKAASPSLRGALGNPVVRGALLGAATGAIASGSSGGKAGKGALVGAGVGAAAGLLENIFSQPSQNSGESDSR